MHSSTDLLTLKLSTPVEVVTTCEDCDHYLSPLLEIAIRYTSEAPLAYGLDTEWVMQDTVALVQLALPQCAGGKVVLVRLCELRATAAAIGEPVQFPTSLAAVLSNDALVAVGVGVNNDLKLLREQWPYADRTTTSICDESCQSATAIYSSSGQSCIPGAALGFLQNGLSGGRCLDLSLLASQLDQGAESSQGKQLGLSTLVARWLGHTLIKDTSLRCGDWGAEILDKAQVEYAALDASAGLSLFHALAASTSSLEDTSRSATANIEVSTSFWASVESVLSRAWFPGEDLAPSRRRGRKTSSNFKRSSGSWNSSTKSKKSYFVPKTRSHYDGCRLHAPNGTHLANINARRAEWYVRQGLGKLLCSPPHDDHACAIQLNFTPKGGPSIKSTSSNSDGDNDHDDASDDVYQRAHRPNCCVGCGAGSIVEASDFKSSGARVGNGEFNGNIASAGPGGSCNSNSKSSDGSSNATSNGNSINTVSGSFGGSEGLNRFSIVPQCFRRLLPVAVKSRSSHDIVLLCHPCRDKAQAAALKRRALLLDAHGLAYHPPPPRIDLQRKAVRSAANALAAHNTAIAREAADEAASSEREASPEEKNTGEVPMPQEISKVKKPKKVKSEVIPAARVAELLEVVRSFLELDDVASIGPSEIEHCRAVDLSPRAPTISSTTASTVAASAAIATNQSSLKKRSRRCSEEEPNESSIGERGDRGIVSAANEHASELNMNGETNHKGAGNATMAQNEGPEAILLERLGLYRCAISSTSSYDNSADVGDVSTNGDGFVAPRGAVQRFVEEWRNLFLEAVQPKLLPEGWRVEHPVWSE